MHFKLEGIKRAMYKYIQSCSVNL